MKLFCMHFYLPLFKAYGGGGVGGEREKLLVYLQGTKLPLSAYERDLCISGMSTRDDYCTVD